MYFTLIHIYVFKIHIFLNDLCKEGKAQNKKINLWYYQVDSFHAKKVRKQLDFVLINCVQEYHDQKNALTVSWLQSIFSFGLQLFIICCRTCSWKQTEDKNCIRLYLASEMLNDTTVMLFLKPLKLTRQFLVFKNPPNFLVFSLIMLEYSRLLSVAILHCYSSCTRIIYLHRIMQYGFQG